MLYQLSSSAGVGRTGVFIALSAVIERLKYEGVVDMFQTVNMLRVQRPLMVQSEVSSVVVRQMVLSAAGCCDLYITS